MRLKGPPSNTGLRLLLLVAVLIVVGAVAYFLYLAPR